MSKVLSLLEGHTTWFGRQKMGGNTEFWMCKMKKNIKPQNHFFRSVMNKFLCLIFSASISSYLNSITTHWFGLATIWYDRFLCGCVWCVHIMIPYQSSWLPSTFISQNSLKGWIPCLKSLILIGIRYNILKRTIN